MSYYIIIRGPLGIGKTTVSKHLSKKLNAKHIEMDTVLKEHHLDTIPPNAPCIPVNQFIKANQIVLSEAIELLEKTTVVIFDACFYHKEVIDNLVQHLPYKHYIFTLKAPLHVCIQRDCGREHPCGKDAATAVHALVSKFDCGMNIDVTNDINQSVETIIKNLPQ